MATVINLRTAPHELRRTCVKIDRTTRWGNPFVMLKGDAAERAFVIGMHRTWLWEQLRTGKVTLEDLAALDGKFLGCWCAPAPCHGHTLARAAIWAKAQLAAKAPAISA